MRRGLLTSEQVEAVLVEQARLTPDLVELVQREGELSAELVSELCRDYDALLQRT